MGTLIRRVTSAGGIGYGVNIWELSPPKAVTGVSTSVIGMVAELPWGPVNEIQTITTPGEFWATFYPNDFATTKDYSTYPAVLALLNKPIFTSGGLKVVRIEPTGAAKSTKTFQDITPTDSVTVEALYYGLLGDSINIAWTANADVAGNRDMTVSIGSNYSVLYENVVTAAGVVTDPGDPYVVVTKHGSYAAVPAVVTATALAGGADGTAVALEYTGNSSTSEGIRLFYGESVDCNVLFCAEVPEALKDAVNAGLEAWCDDTEKGVAVLCTVDGQASADALTYLSGESIASDRCTYHWPRVKTVNFFATDAAELEVDGNAFAAACIANVPWYLSPGGAGKKQGTQDFLRGITGLEDESTSRTTLDLLTAAGVAPWFMSTKLGAIIRRAVTTSLTSGRTKLFRRRAVDYITSSLAGYTEEFVETQLDLTLSSQTLGPNTTALVGGFQSWLSARKGQNQIQDYSVDPWSENTQADIDAGRWTIVITVKLYSMMEEIVLKANIGETVTISEA